MVRGIGTDIIEIQRIRNSLSQHADHFINRICTENERTYCCKHSEPAPQFAGHFCAKEAIAKALGTGISEHLGWLDMEIHHDKLGKPYVVLSERAQLHFQHPTIHISISHCKEYATAVAIWL